MTVKKKISYEVDFAFRVRAQQFLRPVMHMWRHQQWIVTSSTERNLSEWYTGPMCEDHSLRRQLQIWCHVYSLGELFMCLFDCHFGVYFEFPRYFVTREINTKITSYQAH